MRNTESKTITLNYSGTATDTSKLDLKNNIDNKKCIDHLFNDLQEKQLFIKNVDGRLMIQRIPKAIIADFVSRFRIPFLNKKFDSESISEYIKNSIAMPEWDLVIATGDRNNKLQEGETCYWNYSGHNIPLVTRSFDMNQDEGIIRISGNKNRLYEPGIFNSGLTKEQLDQVDKNVKTHQGTNRIAADYLNINRRPLLVIYPLRLNKRNIEKANVDELSAIKSVNYGDPLFGIALGFPGIVTDERVTYVLNKVKIEQLSMDFEYEEDYDPDED